MDHNFTEAISRRRFVKGSILAGGTVAGSALLSGFSQSQDRVPVARPESSPDVRIQVHRKLIAGAARRCVTPSQELFDRVIAEKRYSYHAIKEDTFVRAIVLSNGTKKMAIISSELSVYPLPEELAKILEKEFGIDPLACVIAGTRGHNTFSIGQTSFSEIGEGSADFVKFVHERTVEAVREAIERSVPARIGGAIGESAINACRDYVTPAGTIEAPSRISGAVAKHLPVVRIEDMEGNTIALFINYAMQSACLSWNQFVDTYNYYSGDFVGALTRYLEKLGHYKYPVMWVCGGGDDQHAAFSALIEYCDVDDNGKFVFVRETLPPEATLMIIRQMAAEQSLDVLRTVQSIKNYSDDFDFFCAETYREVPARVSYRQGLGDRYTPEKVITPKPVDRPLKFRYRLAVLNGIAFLGVNADIYSSYFKRACDILGCRTFSLMDACFGNVSSLPDAAAEKNNIYGIGTWGSKCFSSELGENAFNNAVTELAEAYKKRK
jgi:hypothetical protein